MIEIVDSSHPSQRYVLAEEEYADYIEASRQATEFTGALLFGDGLVTSGPSESKLAVT